MLGGTIRCVRWDAFPYKYLKSLKKILLRPDPTFQGGVVAAGSSPLGATPLALTDSKERQGPGNIAPRGKGYSTLSSSLGFRLQHTRNN